MAKRIIFDILLILSVFLAPFWFTAILGLILIFCFKDYYEVVFAFLIFDFLYGFKSDRFLEIPIFFSILALLALTASEFLKKRIRFYDSRI